MRVGTINYWHVSGPSPSYKNRMLADRWRALGLDILLVQEGIGGVGNIIYGTTDSILDLAKMVGANYYSTVCFPCKPWPSWISHYAIGVVAKGNITDATPITISGRTHVACRVNGVPVFSIHIDPNQSTYEQIRRLAFHIQPTGPVIVGGDFNNQAAPEILQLFARTAYQPYTNLIDHIIWRVYEGVVKAEKVDFSDHPFVWAELR